MRDRGGVLIEQILALTLLSVLVVSLFSLLTVGSFAAQIAQQRSLAAGLAAQKLEEIIGSSRDPLPVLRRPVDPGRFPTYHWQVDVAEAGPALREVTVTVWYPVRSREHSVSLTTLVRGGRTDEREAVAPY